LMKTKTGMDCVEAVDTTPKHMSVLLLSRYQNFTKLLSVPLNPIPKALPVLTQVPVGELGIHRPQLSRSITL
jgi:hypothetical protein